MFNEARKQQIAQKIAELIVGSPELMTLLLFPETAEEPENEVVQPETDYATRRSEYLLLVAQSQPLRASDSKQAATYMHFVAQYLETERLTIDADDWGFTSWVLKVAPAFMCPEERAAWAAAVTCTKEERAKTCDLWRQARAQGELRPYDLGYGGSWERLQKDLNFTPEGDDE